MNFRTIMSLAFLLQLRMMGESKLEFFENRIRPVLAENCYECHNSIKQAKSGLVLDYKHGIMKGGERGPAISLTNPKASLLLRVLFQDLPSSSDVTSHVSLGFPLPFER